MPEFFKSFNNSITLLKDTEYMYAGDKYYVDTVIKTSYYTPGTDYTDGAPTVQIMVDLASMTEQLYKKYPDLETAGVGFDVNADTAMFPGTEDMGYALFPYLAQIL